MKPSKNLIIILAAAVILLSAWVYYMSQTGNVAVDFQREFKSVTKQSSSDDPEEIEKDLDETEFEDLDDEVTDIEAELNTETETKTQ